MATLISIRSIPADEALCGSGDVDAYHRQIHERRRAWLGIDRDRTQPARSGRDGMAQRRAE